MPSTMTPEAFIKKWTAVNLAERSAAQQPFLDVCALLGQPVPAEADPDGSTFTFEKGGTTATGGHGWADVWKKGAFAWEYKGPGKDLNAAYLQLKNYADMLENPPLLITSDTKRIEIHTNFTNTVKTVHVLNLVDLADPAKRDLLREAFVDPEKLRPGITRHQVTKEAAETFSQLAHHLQSKGFEPKRVAHFLNRLIFCMFAEDVGLLPNKIFTKLATASVAHPATFEANAKQLFAGMAKGGTVAFEVIDWFNGGLFDDDSTLPLDAADIKIVLRCAEMDWTNIEPSIFGTLFERGLDPDKRSQQGTHYTDPDTIMKIVRPVVIEPWEREWEAQKVALSKLTDRAKKSVSEAAKDRYHEFLERLSIFRVFDPACGSGNFLYLSLRGLKDFEKRVIHDAETLGLAPPFPRVGPEAVFGIEVNPYAAELARVTIWIGELQWMLENGFHAARDPILKTLDQIECRDAILNEDGTEPTWPKVDAIVGNPPFLGDKKMRRELGESYVNRLRALYATSVPGGADLVTYWFAKAIREAALRKNMRVGLVATNSIRGGANRRVLEDARTRLPIFCAWSDEPWVNEGAAVRVSMVCFGQSDVTKLDGQEVSEVFADLTGARIDSHADVDLTKAVRLRENAGLSFMGITKSGPFDISGDLARQLLKLPNPHGRPNSDVLFPTMNGADLAKRPSGSWIINFGLRSEAEASLYEAVYEYALKHIKPARIESRTPSNRANWWRFERPRPEMYAAFGKQPRYIATCLVSKHRFFVWLHRMVVPENVVIVVARSDDTTFGVLQSRIHELWALRQASWLGVGNDPRYTPTTTFETFPFPVGVTPDLPADSFNSDNHANKIAEAARSLNSLRENWLSPPELIDRVPEIAPSYPDRIVPRNKAASEELKKRTLTNLYNANPAWLQNAQRELDAAVAAAYGWQWPLSDEAIIERLFELNQRRAIPLDIRPSASKRGKAKKQ